jgi:hypothetical protein
MDIGVVLQTTPPAARVIDLAKRAETYGFSHVWTFDSHILWEEPYVDLLQDPRRDPQRVVGPMVTNPATRDWTVTASTYATLNEMYGNRTVCGIGRGDSAVRVTNGKPTTLATMRESMHVIRELANGRSVDYKGSTITLPWATKSRARGLRRGVRAQGPAADRRDLRRLHPAARRSLDRRVDDRCGPHGSLRRRSGSRRHHRRRRRPGLRGRRPGLHARPVPMVRRHGRQPRGRHRRALRGVGSGAPGPHRLHQGSRGLRLQPARPGGQHPHRRSCPTRSSTASASSAPSRRSSSGSTHSAISASTSSRSISSTTARTTP